MKDGKKTDIFSYSFTILRVEDQPALLDTYFNITITLHMRIIVNKARSKTSIDSSKQQKMVHI